MKPEELATLVRKCEDAAQLSEFVEFGKKNHPLISDLCSLRVTRGWSEQHFLAICVVVLMANETPAAATT